MDVLKLMMAFCRGDQNRLIIDITRVAFNILNSNYTKPEDIHLDLMKDVLWKIYDCRSIINQTQLLRNMNSFVNKVVILFSEVRT